MVAIAFIGVHGIGKTTTARSLNKHGFRYKPVEAIHVAYGLKPIERQTLFFVKYVYDFLSMLSRAEGKNVVFDSHPLITLPYTEYWLSRSGVGASNIKKTISSFTSILGLLPSIDMIVYLKMNRIDVVVERILSRKRFSASEEIDPDYIRFIDERLGDYMSEQCPNLARRCLEMDGTLELQARKEKILSILEKEGILLKEYAGSNEQG